MCQMRKMDVCVMSECVCVYLFVYICLCIFVCMRLMCVSLHTCGPFEIA